MAGASAERVRGDLVWLVHQGADVREFSLAAARILARAVPFDGVCVLTTDPATMLPTGEVVENGLPPEAGPRIAEIEIGGEDFNAFAALARSERRARSLSEATNRDLARSRRHRELRRPHGLGDELRAALVDDSRLWGGLTLMRRSDQPHFAPADAALVASMSVWLAEGLRRALLLATADRDDREEAVGFVLLAPDNTVDMSNAAADAWLAELDSGGSLPPVVAAVASCARRIVDEHDATRAIARARVRTTAGRWLLVRGSKLGDDAHTAVTIEPARPHELAPLIADAYGLTDRERAVTQLVAQGLPTNAVADRLHLSPWTVQDHLKSIFERVGVSTRGELVARVFFDHFAPRLNHEKTS